jgi:hypothetical protein
VEIMPLWEAHDRFVADVQANQDAIGQIAFSIFVRLTQSKQSEKRIQRTDRTITDPESIRDGEAQIQPERDCSTARRPQSALVRLRQTGDKPLQRFTTPIARGISFLEVVCWKTFPRARMKDPRMPKALDTVG